MTEKSANESYESAAKAALHEPFNRASRELAAWGEKVARGFPHADVEFFADAGSRGRTRRAALRIMFTRAVTGKAADHADYAGLWVLADHRPNRDVIYEVRPYRGPDDKFGASNRSSDLPRWFGFAARHTFWSLNDLPLVEEHEGFDRALYFSSTGALPWEIPNHLNRLYYNGYRKGVLEDPVAVLAALPPRPGMMLE